MNRALNGFGLIEDHVEVVIENSAAEGMDDRIKGGVGVRAVETPSIGLAVAIDVSDQLFGRFPHRTKTN